MWGKVDKMKWNRGFKIASSLIEVIPEAIEKTETEEFKQAMWAGQANILVAVRLRPLLGHDMDKNETVKELDNKMVVVMDPGNSKDVIGKLRKRTREKRYAFHHVFSPSDGQVRTFVLIIFDLYNNDYNRRRYISIRPSF